MWMWMWMWVGLGRRPLPKAMTKRAGQAGRQGRQGKARQMSKSFKPSNRCRVDKQSAAQWVLGEVGGGYVHDGQEQRREREMRDAQSTSTTTRPASSGPWRCLCLQPIPPPTSRPPQAETRTAYCLRPEQWFLSLTLRQASLAKQRLSRESRSVVRPDAPSASRPVHRRHAHTTPVRCVHSTPT